MTPKALILSFTVIFALFGADVTYYIKYMNDEAPRMSKEAVKQIVNNTLNPEESNDPYSKVAVNVYCEKNSTVDYLVVYMSRADIYLVLCYRLEMEGSNVVEVIEDYVEEESNTDKCYACPDPDVEALFSTSITEVQTAEDAINYAADIAEGVGLKTKKLLYGEQTGTNVKDYLSCPKLRIWGFVGHGNSQLIQVYASESITYSYFQSLGPDALKDVTIILNSCDVHKAPLEGSLFAAGTYFYGGGDETIEAGKSEDVMKAFIRKAVDEKMEMMQAGEEAEDEIQYYLYGWSGDGSGPPYYFKGSIAFYLNVTSPQSGDVWDLGTFHSTTWESNVDGNVKIDLLKGTSVLGTLVASTENDGKETIKIADDLDVGDDYKIQISSIEYDTVVNESNEFSISEGTVVSVFPYEINYDEVLALPEGWIQDQEDDIDWVLISGPTPSRKGVDSDPDKTGPEGDHTTGGDYYLYVEASGDNSPEKEASLLTPKFDLSNLPDPILNFWVHMFSADNEMGDVYVDIYVDGEWNSDVVHLQDDHGDEWFEVKQSLNDYVGERVRIRIRAITGESWCSDIAIDDFKVAEEPTYITTHQKTITSYDLRYVDSKIRYQIPENMNNDLSIKLYSTQGKLVCTLVNGPQNAGSYSIALNSEGKELAAGLYMCLMKTKTFSKTINILIQK